MGNKTYHISVIYHSTIHIGRRMIWYEINSLQPRYCILWCVLGDFNATLGAHEKNGRHHPKNTFCDKFQSWIYYNNLIHLNTYIILLTWFNGMRGLTHTSQRLNILIYNVDWLDFWDSIRCYTFPKSHSDHHQLC